MQTPAEAFFPDNRRYEYFLQRLRLVASDKIPILRVEDIRDVPNSPDGVPEIEVLIRIPGLKINNPVTGKRMILTDWIKKYFEGEYSQKGYLDAMARYLERSIPVEHLEANLKPKFAHYRDGTPSDLPPRAALFTWLKSVAHQVAVARDWLRGLKRPKQEFNKQDRENFLKQVEPRFWWAKYVHEGRIALPDIAKRSPRTTAIDVLALKFKKGTDAIKARLRKEV